MQKVKDPNGLKAEVRKQLRSYLESVGTEFSSNGQMFQCPNRSFHANNDQHFSCGFPSKDSEDIWHCFTCNTHGDIFDAAHLLENCPKDGNEWMEKNLIYLAKKLGVTVELEELSPEEHLRLQAYEVLAAVAALAHNGLWKSEAAAKAVKERGWDEQIAGHFMIGYCAYDKLIDVLSRKGYGPDVLTRAGIVHRDLFDHRLLFPIKDVKGRVVAFASRQVRDDGLPKYINSGTTPVYTKSEVLYNLHKVQGDTVYLVEGFADVITMVRSGFANTVGLCGVSLTDDHISTLLRKGIRKIILCLDTDAAGQAAEEKIMSSINKAHGIEVLLKQRDECKDADECLRKHDFLLTSPNLPMFEHYLGKFEATEDKLFREKALRAILLEKSPIDRENLCKKMAKQLGVRVEVVLSEFDHIVEKDGDIDLVSSADILKEKSLFDQDLLAFEKVAWSRDKLLGLSAKDFPVFTEDMDGLQSFVYVFAGEQGTGKSAFTRNLTMNILETQPDKAFVLYVSLDETIDEVIARFLAMNSGLEINTMKNPKFRIQYNENMDQQTKERHLARYVDSLRKLRDLSNSFAIKDETHIRNMQDIERFIKIYKDIAEGRQLIVVVDSLHRVRIPQKYNGSMRETAVAISDAIKRWRNDYRVSMITTAELRKTNEIGRRPNADDIKEASDFKYDADAVGMMYNDAGSRGGIELSKLKHEIPELGLTIPIVEVNYAFKNRTSAFKGRHYYKFFSDFHKLVECTRAEMKHWHAESFPIVSPDVKLRTTAHA